ncbi:protein SMAX1-LIKE 3 [Lolium rigidum]|uniref:protein SMAX1-LIKE 3 n=1 Tax=Lolium rigidum TaxID=89674 RepID=UPI001F5D61A4|nr:protein SMAX1-LIKE 3 [Lolium rigidum]
MRAGGCTVQQALTAEAAGVVKQAVSLARRRGNAQVTPLHVASAMLAAPAGLLRAACLRSHSHPLQCKALELCFNVALNRLPASAAVASSPLLGGHGHHHYYPPSLSNALVAAFKRAQAHQRRGSVDSQQQPVLAVKIELEQLVVSILDDPSVSRVMREAGFSSTQIKANVEQTVCSPTTTAATADPQQNPNPSSTATTSKHHQETTKAKLPLGQVRDEDVGAVLHCLAARSKTRVVVIAESTAAAEATVRAAMDKVKRGDAKHDALRSAQVVSLRVSSFRDMPREEAERRLAELRCLVKSRGHVLLVVEDLKWAAEFWARHVQGGGRRGYYCPVEHVVTDVRALAGGDQGLWLVGFGTYQTYMKCRAGQPSLESLWGLQTLTVPAGSLALSLTCAFDDSALVNQSMKASSDTDGNGPVPRSWPLLGGAQLTSRCCGDCSVARTDTKAALPPSFVSSSSIPSWLQHCRHQEPTHFMDLGRNWSSICSKPSQRMTLHFSAPVSPASSISSYEHGHQPRQSWLLADMDGKHPWKPKSEAGAKVSSHDSGASNGSVEVECRSRFKELNAENLKLLCAALEKEVPWQKEIVPEIASTVLQCRSGIAKRRDKSRSTDAKEETWLFFLGGDADGKEKVARELANLVFGSVKNFVSIKLGAASSPSASCSAEEHRSKRPRTSAASEGEAYLERLYEAISENPHRVILMEDFEEADQYCQVGIKEAIDSGVIRTQAGDEVGVSDTIVILSCESFDSKSRACSPPGKQMKPEMGEIKEDHTTDHDHKEGGASSSCFDLNLNIESEHADEPSSDDVCLLTAVDRTLFFRRQDGL